MTFHTVFCQQAPCPSPPKGLQHSMAGVPRNAYRNFPSIICEFRTWTWQLIQLFINFQYSRIIFPLQFFRWYVPGISRRNIINAIQISQLDFCTLQYSGLRVIWQMELSNCSRITRTASWRPSSYRITRIAPSSFIRLSRCSFGQLRMA